jgi:hypothetical protein
VAGLNHPEDLEAWHAWQARLHRLRRLKTRLRSPEPARLRLTVGGFTPRLLVVLESLSPSNRAASVAPLHHLPLADVAVLSVGDVLPVLPDHPWTVHHDLEAHTAELRAVLAPGHYTELGHRAWLLSHQRRVPFLVGQHGLMTPLAPPLPADAHLLAWSQADADFWWSGRGGEATVVGSQLLWAAGTNPLTEVGLTATPTYLGQLHGAELPRRHLARAAGQFCSRHGATYRPHPSESDRFSRWQHARWERRGISIDRTGSPLREQRDPVVSVFSTGVLEAAARGVPAWVDFPEPPAWLEEFWERYGMRRYGGDPTPAPARAATEPAAAVAAVLRSYL